ncbi:putative cytochrome P450 [Pleomassaria siparia CBS 279.74]|uniref:Putative cytochrome P450 n=1 Tax=Pleomassaria siparia CBS 279.74 TaxID=1314801 RepID=A0A6G1K831_9PLEO|nr:putative cytochrome P450 [Pleomassaria siparia CBS 279.74]
MFISIFATLVLLVFLVLLSSAWSLVRNYLIARKIGVPVIIIPISSDNPIWMLTARHVLRLLKYVPFGSGSFSRFSYPGWQFDDRYRAHQELGDVVLFTTPGLNWIYLCNADAIHDVIRRERQGEFIRPTKMLAALNVFGPNLSTLNGADWQRHRKCTAASFNERTNTLVWSESLRQGQQVVQYWENVDTSKTSTLAQDTRTLTLDVMAHAAFGKSFDFYGAQDKKISSGPLSYRDALAIILENAILVLALGPDALQWLSSFFPALRLVSDAVSQFKKYMTDMFEENTQMAQEKEAQGNLMTSLVRASVDDNLLSREEVMGNMFVYNFAGHDTTAHAFAFTFMLLALNPAVQDWMAEEITYILEGEPTSEVNYSLYPRFVRTLAVLLETLRLYNPLLSIVKGTENQPARLTIGTQNIVVPPHTRLILNLQALQTHPRYWGNDGLEWKPSRWIQAKPGDGSLHDREYIITSAHDAYIPFSEGNRSCPGKKFAQVEHVAVMIAMFRDHCVAPKRRDGESEMAARGRALATLEDTGMVLLLQMLNPEKTALKWTKRR